MRNRPSPFLFVFLALLFWAPLAHAGKFPHQVAPPGTSRIAGTVPFDLYQGNFIVARGSIGPLKNLNFFVDTGTTPAVLDARIARKLDLPNEEPASILVLGGKTQGKFVSLPTVELGPVKRSNLPVVTTDLSFFEKFLPVRIDAIVGIDVLGQEPFVIDYSARVIRFGSTPVLPVSVPLRLDHGMAVFEVDIDHTPEHLLLDTGAGSIILFDKTALQDPNAQNINLSTQKVGDFESKHVWLRTLKLGPEEFRRKPALMTRNPKPSQLDYDGLISPAALGISQVAVDLQRGLLAFSR
ncbi:MAG TPA: retropepsin-like aspartic protease [Terracidiphilus sp.]|nr:retropepsin-like aspartic protease [Terracidiphilus sp.]